MNRAINVLFAALLVGSHALAADKKLFIRQADHFAWEGSNREELRLQRGMADWFGTGNAS